MNIHAISLSNFSDDVLCYIEQNMMKEFDDELFASWGHDGIYTSDGSKICSIDISIEQVTFKKPNSETVVVPVCF